MVKRFSLYKEGDYKVKSNLKARWLGPMDLKYIETGKNTFWEFMGEMMIGCKCLGLISNGTVLSYLWVNLKNIEYYGLKIVLKENECYLYSAMTKPDKRGNGYAEILRSKCYEMMRSQGRDMFYSITDSNNKSAVRFKEKIGAKIVTTYKYFKLWKYEKLSEL